MHSWNATQPPLVESYVVKKTLSFCSSTTPTLVSCYFLSLFRSYSADHVLCCPKPAHLWSSVQSAESKVYTDGYINSALYDWVSHDIDYLDLVCFGIYQMPFMYCRHPQFGATSYPCRNKLNKIIRTRRTQTGQYTAWTMPMQIKVDRYHLSLHKIQTLQEWAASWWILACRGHGLNDFSPIFLQRSSNRPGTAVESCLRPPEGTNPLSLLIQNQVWTLF